MSTLFQASLFDEPTGEVPSRVGRASVRAIETNHLLTPGKGRTSAFDFTLNPYRGCSFGCSYCYAAFFVPDEAQRAEWGLWVEAKVRAAEVLRRRDDLYDKRIYMSSVTDPYQPLERKLGLTREIVEVLAQKSVRLVVQTRSPLAARDADLFQRFKHVRVNMSITTDDEEARKQFEPGCASIEQRLEAVETLIAAGITVNVCVCPMLPMRDPFAFGRRLSDMGVAAVAASWFHSGDRPFAAGTQDRAFVLAKHHGWTQDEFKRCRDQLQRGCAAYGATAEAFGPA
jgi:DNA repair photolyase